MPYQSGRQNWQEDTGSRFILKQMIILSEIYAVTPILRYTRQHEHAIILLYYANSIDLIGI